MRGKLFISAFAGLGLAVLLAVPGRAAIKGDYLEARSADVYTGPCFANGEVGLVGDEAILAWKIDQGDWDGTSLNGLAVVAVVKAHATLGDPYHSPYPAESVLIVDQKANAQQRLALQEFASSMAGKLLSHVVRVEAAPIELTLATGEMHGAAQLVAGNLASITTRSLCQGDDKCGNEIVYYPPLVHLAHAMPAFTLEDSFHGQGLNVVWNHIGKRSAFVGSFSVASVS
ncbi:conserved exported hypothetical protein [Acidobacteriia bacterium SbA2]|nr:conserved exported hypothetical protein [Acidobacteriia bacterium SbA2]